MFVAHMIMMPLFERMLGELAARLEDRPPRPGKLSDFVAGIGLGDYRSNLVRFVDAAAGPRLPARMEFRDRHRRQRLKVAVPLLLGIVPRPIRSVVPISVRRLGRRWMA